MHTQCLAHCREHVLFLPNQLPHPLSFGSRLYIFLSSCGMGGVASILWLQALTNNSGLATNNSNPQPSDY